MSAIALTLLQAAASLLLTVQTSPNLSVSLKQQAITVAQQAIQIATHQIQGNTTTNWRIYRNEEYGFTLEYPPGADDNYSVHETDPISLYEDKFLSDVDVVKNNGGFGVEITIFKNAYKKNDKESLQSAIKEFYGPGIVDGIFPWPDASVQDFSIDHHAAIKSIYTEPSESSVGTPAVLIYTSNSEYVYRISYMGDLKEGERIVSTFKFLK